MATETKQILEKLDAIKSELDYIKENMIDADMILSEDDRTALKKANEEFEKGETISHEDIKRELGL